MLAANYLASEEEEEAKKAPSENPSENPRSRKTNSPEEQKSFESSSRKRLQRQSSFSTNHNDDSTDADEIKLARVNMDGLLRNLLISIRSCSVVSLFQSRSMSTL